MNICNTSLIKNLGLILWKIRYPVVLEDNGLVRLLRNLRLLIISDFIVSLDDVFIRDVIRSMCVDLSETYSITVDQINTVVLPSNCLVCCWWIGVNVLCNFCDVNISTPSLKSLKCNINAKCSLWNQINRFVYRNY